MEGVQIKPSFRVEIVHRDKHGNIKSVETAEISAEEAVSKGIVTQEQIDQAMEKK
jgi:hypothetical protein